MYNEIRDINSSDNKISEGLPHFSSSLTGIIALCRESIE